VGRGNGKTPQSLPYIGIVERSILSGELELELGVESWNVYIQLPFSSRESLLEYSPSLPYHYTTPHHVSGLGLLGLLPALGFGSFGFPFLASHLSHLPIFLQY